MKSHLKKTVVAVIMSVVMILTPMGTGEMQSYAATSEKTYQGGYWLLKRGQEVPENFDDLDNASMYWGGWGTISKKQTVIGDEDSVTESIVSIPEETTRKLEEGETIRWFAERKVGMYYQVYGEIVEEVEVTPTPEPVKTYQGGYWLVKRDQEMPESFDDFANTSMYWGGWGTISKEQTVIGDEDSVTEAIVSIPEETKRKLNEGETIRWFAERKVGMYYQVYGEIVSEEDVYEEDIYEEDIYEEEVEEEDIYGTVGNVATKATVEPTVTPTVTATVEPTVPPTATPTSTCQAFFRILSVGDQCPTDLSEISNCSWSYGGMGTITGEKSVYGEETVRSMIVTVGSDVQKQLNEDEDIRWIAITKPCAFWTVYGEIYNVNVENSRVNGAVESDETEVIVDTVEDMKNLKEIYSLGTVIKTRGFYKVGDGGAATYKVSFRGTGGNFTSFVTATGQYVNYIVENDTINLKQLGAGVCEEIIYNTSNIEYNDDAERFNEALGVIDQYDGGILNIPSGEYRCASKINIGGNNYTIQGNGNATILYTDNGYKGDEHFITITGDDISLDNFRVEARETKGVAYYRQCSVMYANRIQITNCEFSVKENVIAYDGNTDRQYTNVTLYTGWHDITIDNCLMEQMGCVERGASLGIIDMWSSGCSGATITNCTMRQNAHDEMLGIFTQKGANAAITDVYIANNNMYASSASNVSKKTMAITIGYDESKAISNVRFVDNYVKAEVPSNFMTFGSVSDCVIADNTFDIVHTVSYDAGVVFDTRDGVTVKDNRVTIKNVYSKGGVQQVFKRYGTFINNNIDCQGYVYYFMYLGGKAIGNTINLAGGCAAVAVEVEEFSQNKVTSNGKVDNFAVYANLNTDSLISENVFSYDYDDSGEEASIPWEGYFVYAGFHAKLNGHAVTVSDNVISCSDKVSSQNKGLLCYGIGDKDDAEQIFIFKNNQVGKYKWVRSLYGQSLGLVSLENNMDENNVEVTMQTRLTYCMENVE